MSIDSDPRSGRPGTSTDKRSVKLVAGPLREDCHATCDELFRAMEVPAKSVFHILTYDLKKRKISVQCVLHWLTAEQKQKCLNTATFLKERFDVEDNSCIELSLLMKCELGTLNRS